MAAKSRGARKSRRSITRHNLITDPDTSARLARIRQHGTSPELAVRRVLHCLGHSYRLHNRDLPGSPDLANRRQGWAIFVHGCFWHRHRNCSRTTTPRRNREFWQNKFDANIARDRRALEELQARGFRTVVIWECQTETAAQLERTLRAALLNTIQTRSSR
ncbi:MAG: very short patch repair endonuclease [Proteobacteria bacterium]|nr:MAG: very short patch repair endonuclease [Pseudomonadota bacterium]